MAKKVTKKLKLVIVGGKATPAPPTGPALGQVIKIYFLMKRRDRQPVTTCL
ncbi:MAG: hypothetical protein CEO12_627, partial [Parcubacteria group bacterium Gr01-1014_46]